MALYCACFVLLGIIMLRGIIRIGHLDGTKNLRPVIINFNHIIPNARSPTNY